MKRLKSKKTYQLTLTIVLAALLLFSCNHKPPLIAVDGRISSEQFDPYNAPGIHRLQGDFQYVAGKLIDAVQFGALSPEEIGLAPTESPWNQPAAGCATYRLIIEHPVPVGKAATPLALYLKAPSSSCRILINGVEADSIGTPSEQRMETREIFRNTRIRLDSSQPRSEIIFQVANLHYIQGGLDTPIYFGNLLPVQNYQLRQNSYASFVIGTLFMLAVYLFLLYFHDMRLKSHLFLALFASMVIVYLLTMNDFLIMNYLPMLSAQSLMKTAIIAYAGSGISLLLFTQTLFSHFNRIKAIPLMIISICILIILTTLILPYGASMNILLNVLHITAFFGSIFITVLYIKAIRGHDYKAWSHLVAWLAFSVAVVIDILNSLFVTQYGAIFSFFPAGIIVFIFGHTQILAAQHGLTGKRLAKLSGEFEQELSTRTSMLRQLNEKLAREAVQDKLTGLYNRTRLENFMHHESAFHSRLSLLFLDLDNFKQINDNFGHDAGDIVIREFSSLIKNEIRPNDVPVRLGGDEFIVILPDTPASGAAMLARRILRDLSSREGFVLSISKVLTSEQLEKYSPNITCSIGIAERRNNEPLENLIQHADKALLSAKEEGKNGYVVYREG